jgi:hypothetical protein
LVEPEEPGILGRAIISELPKDERAIPDNLEVGPAVSRRRAKARQEAEVLSLIIGGGRVRPAHGRTPDQRGLPSGASYADHAGSRAARAGIAPRPAVEEEDVDILRGVGEGVVVHPRVAVELFREGVDEERVMLGSAYRTGAAVGQGGKDASAAGGVYRRCLGIRPRARGVVATASP